jgi:hypothetical protein
VLELLVPRLLTWLLVVLEYGVKRSPCRSTMLRQEEVDFIKAISTLQLSPALLGELRMALTRRKTKPAVAAGSRSTASLIGARASQRTCSQLAGKRKANELGSSGGSFELANRRPAPGDGSTPLPASASATGEQDANFSRQLGPPEGGATSPRFSQVGRSSPQPRVRISPNPLSHPRHPTRACLTTCPGL